MNFFFIYDDSTTCLSDEEDSKDAVVLYFPLQGGPDRHMLCCQLAGVARFMKNTFSSPTVVGLEYGKFAFHWSGKYLLGLGADNEVHTSILKDQLLFLCGIFCFYHGNMDNVRKECPTDFHQKLELCWSRYISLSQCFALALPVKLGPKEGSRLVSAANRLLHACQVSSDVTAGCVFYNSRVLSTQFPPHFTNYLSLLSNANASAHLDDAQPIPKDLPPGVELKRIHLSPRSASDIHRLNHSSVGSQLRLKTKTRSGSDADVDSDSLFHSRNKTRKWSHHDFNFFSSRLGTLEKKLLASKNRYLLTVAGLDICSHEDFEINDSFSPKRDSVFEALHQYPSHLKSRSPSLSRHEEGFFSFPSRSARLSSLKRWNSDLLLGGTSQSTSHRARTRSERTTQTDLPKLQVLKCRSKSTSKKNSSKRPSIGKKEHSRNFCDIDHCPNIEENDAQKHILYVLKYGNSTLVLLIAKSYDKKTINYLWNCGFTYLRELECIAEKQELDHSSSCEPSIEPSFYILSYNHAQRTLKEYPRSPSLLLSEKHSWETLHKIRQGTDAHTMCLLSSTYSVFSCHKDQTMSFYVQPEASSRKLDPLGHLESKAKRRLHKYFKLSL